MQENCTVDRQCQADHFCDQRRCIQITHGSPCPQHCSFLCPVGYLLDDDTGRCFAMGIKLRRMHSGTCRDSTDCPCSHYCDPELKRCLVHKHEDEPCRSDLECDRNFKCLSKTLTCAAPCDADWLNCSNGKWCDTSIHATMGYCLPSGYANMQPVQAVTTSARDVDLSADPVGSETSSDKAWKWYFIFIIIVSILLLILAVLLFIYFYILRKKRRNNQGISPKRLEKKPDPFDLNQTASLSPLPLTLNQMTIEKEQYNDSKNKSEQEIEHLHSNDREKKMIQSSSSCHYSDPASLLSQSGASSIRIPSPYIPYIRSEDQSSHVSFS